MKPWEREIKELERFFCKTQESENQKANSRAFDEKQVAEASATTLHMIQHLKERNKKELLCQYFNYGFDEATFKTYINQQVHKFYEQSRITQALKERDDGDTAKH